MSLIYVCCGDKLNLLERVASTNITVSPGASTSFPVTALFDRLGSDAFWFNGIALNSNVVVDGNLVLNGGMELPGSNGALLSSWTVAAGTVVESNSAPHSGTYCMQLTAAATVPVATQVITIRSGERLNFSFFLKSDGTHTVAIQVYNQKTHSYLTTAGWTKTQSNFFSTTLAAWTQSNGGATFTIAAESILPFGDLMELQITVTGNATANSFADDCYVWPSVDHFSMHGMLPPGKPGTPLAGLEPGLAVEWDSAPDGSTWTTLNTPTVQAPVLWYSPTTPDDQRYHRFQVNGTPNLYVPFGGEMILSQKLVLNQGHTVKKPVTFNSMQLRSKTEAVGEPRAYLESGWSARTFDLEITFTSLANMQQFRDQVWARSGFGSIPMVVIPAYFDPEICVLAQLAETWNYTQEATAVVPYYSGSKFKVVELPHPVFVS